MRTREKEKKDKLAGNGPITLPHAFKYRSYQKPIVEFMRSWGKRAVIMFHRRAWKDKTMFNLCVEMAMREVGGYAYILPSYAQWKKIIWDSIDKDWNQFRGHIPKQLLVWENGTELKFTLANGSFIQILWSENIDSLRGISPRGIVFSEYAYQNPTAWEVMRPILAENWGWAIFNSTPNGKNHFFEMMKMASSNPSWFSQVLDVTMTKDDNGNRIVTDEYITQEREGGMSEEMIQQEYFCSFDVWAIGSYYSTQMEEAREDGRITTLPFSPETPIDLYFDLWVNDSFTIAFKQNAGMFYNFVNYYESTGKELSHYFAYIDDYLKRKNAKLGTIYLPHDSKQKGHSFLVSGITIIDKFKEKWWAHNIKYLPNDTSVNVGIQEVRRLFPKMRFDIDSCSQLIKCLDNYKKDWDDKKKVFRDSPLHDWASHGADSIRYFAVSPKAEYYKPQQERARSFFNRRTGKMETVINKPKEHALNKNL